MIKKLANDRRHSARKRKPAHNDRKGAMLPLVAITLSALISLAALAINLAYIELARTELRLANDAAAKAAIVTLGRTQSVDQARADAITIGARHSVSGVNYSIAPANVVFGNSTVDANGKYTFRQNTNPINAVRVLGDLSGSSRNLLLGGGTFTLTEDTIATRVDHDIALVIDRSGSMAWDLSNVAYQYPGDQLNKSQLQNYFTIPHATLSRWAALRTAVADFNTIISNNPAEVRAGLVTYAANYNFGNYSATVTSLNQDLTNNFSLINTALTNIGNSPLLGDTNIAAGLDRGVQLLNTSTGARMTASKTIVLLSDGLQTQGTSPVDVATAARASNIRIHTIAFSSQADVGLLQQVATAGGGDFYLANDAASLRAAFRKIAASIPSILTE